MHRLRRRLSAADARAASLLAAQHPATLIAFDLLHLDGRAVRALPYHGRRELLERALCQLAMQGVATEIFVPEAEPSLLWPTAGVRRRR